MGTEVGHDIAPWLDRKGGVIHPSNHPGRAVGAGLYTWKVWMSLWRLTGCPQGSGPAEQLFLWQRQRWIHMTSRERVSPSGQRKRMRTVCDREGVQQRPAEHAPQ